MIVLLDSFGNVISNEVFLQYPVTEVGPTAVLEERARPKQQWLQRWLAFRIAEGPFGWLKGVLGPASVPSRGCGESRDGMTLVEPAAEREESGPDADSPAAARAGSTFGSGRRPVRGRRIAARGHAARKSDEPVEMRAQSPTRMLGLASWSSLSLEWLS
ncbi:MAG: hypothetical protein HQ518_07740 [Rhodopirellula sp.]|nr:hypothetical protein [Rhodopirellula sp.]